MLGVTRSRGHRQYIRRRGQKREVSNHGNGSASSVRLLVLCAALASAIGGGGQGQVLAVSSSSGHRPGFLGLGFGREKTPAVPEPLSLGDRVRSFGERVRTGGVAGLAAGKGGGRASGGAKAEARAMAAAKVRSEGQQTPTGRSNGKNSFIAGGLAGSISMTITCPIEVSRRLAAGVFPRWEARSQAQAFGRKNARTRVGCLAVRKRVFAILKKWRWCAPHGM